MGIIESHGLAANITQRQLDFSFPGQRWLSVQSATNASLYTQPNVTNVRHAVWAGILPEVGSQLAEKRRFAGTKRMPSTKLGAGRKSGNQGKADTWCTLPNMVLDDRRSL